MPTRAHPTRSDMYLLRQRAVFSFAAFFGAGVITAYLLDTPAVVMLACAVVLGLLAALARFWGKSCRALSAAGLVMFYLAAGCAGGAYTAARVQARPEFETTYNAVFRGCVSGSPYTDNDGERFVCTLSDITVNGAPVSYDMRLYLRGGADALSAIGCGQYVSGTGHVYCPEASSNPHEFDFGDYLWREGMAGYVTANYADVDISGERGGISDALYSARAALSSRIDAAFPRSADLVRALVLGDRREMSDDVREDFSAAGVAHLLAISGLHITLMAMALSLILKRLLGVWPATAVTVVCILAYGALIGFSPSISRAAIMYIALSGAPLFGRPSEGSTRLALTFLILLLIDPLNIADAGFVLSFSASAGLIWLDGPLMRLTRLDRVGRGRKLYHRIIRYTARLAGATLSAQLLTYPALAMFYGTFSIISIISNIFLVPLCLVSLVAAYLGIAVPALAFIPDAMLALLRHLVSLCAGISWAEIAVPAPQIWLWLGMFAVGLAVSELSLLPAKIKPWLLPALPALIVISLLTAPRPGLSIVFLDVGQADSAVIRTGGVTCVVDLGEDGAETIDYISGENLTVDMLFLSHPHSDHAGGLGELIESCEVKMIYIPSGWFGEMDGEELESEWQQAMDMGIPFAELSPGDQVRLTDDALITICDSAVNTGDSGNDLSLIMLLDYGESEVLFTGDANAGAAPDVDILKVGHHGSRDATDLTVVQSATPQAAVISVGYNYYGHPSDEVIALLADAGAEVYRTDECGAITVNMDLDGDYEITTFREAAE